MKWLGVLPYVYKPFYDDCVATMHPEFKKHVMFVDNTKKNVGIMRAHNMGVDNMMEDGADWLVIISAAIRFGDQGGLDFIQVLEDHPDHYIIHAGTPNSAVTPNIKEAKDEPRAEYRNGVFGWHLTAFKREVFENIGKWDENFTPYGYDDIDLSIRIQSHYNGAPGWGTFPVDVSDTVMAHSLHPYMGGVVSLDQPKADYFQRKWGRLAAEYKKPSYEHPFNNPRYDIKYWPQSDSKLCNKEAWDHLKEATS